MLKFRFNDFNEESDIIRKNYYLLIDNFLQHVLIKADCTHKAKTGLIIACKPVLARML